MAKKALLKIPVAYGNINVGEEYARIGIKISRGNLTPSQADKQFCGKRITAHLSAGPPGAQGSNGALPGMKGDLELEGIFDCKSFSVGGKFIGTGLTAALASIDLTEMVKFAKREGILTVEAAENIPEEESGEDDEEGTEDDEEGTEDDE